MTIHSTIPAGTETGHERISARYGAAQAFVPPLWNTTLDALLDHRSARHYLPNALPSGTVELLVAAAQSAPSSSNLQAWSVIAVEDSERKQRLAALTGGNAHIVAAPLLLVWLVDLKRARDIARDHGNTGQGLDYLESFLIGAVDAALAAQNAVVAGDSLGFGSCYIGGLRNRPEDVARELELPPETVAIFGLTVGYPDPAAGSDVKPRLPQSSVLFRERYGEVAKADLEAYDERLGAFQKQQGIPAVGWTTVLAQRIADGAALRERTGLKAVLRRLGFALG